MPTPTHDLDAQAAELLGGASYAGRPTGADAGDVPLARAQAAALATAAKAAQERYDRLLAGTTSGAAQPPYMHAAMTDTLGGHATRIGRTEAALAATTVINQLSESFPQITTNPFVRAGLPWAPMLLLAPEKRGSGVGSLLSDPRVWSLALVAGLAIAGQMQGGNREPSRVRIIRELPKLVAGNHQKVLAEATDDRGCAMPLQKITFSSSDPAVAEVDGDGLVKAVAPGTSMITATVDGRPHLTDVVTVRVG
jgi:hypothetical protein